MTTDPLALLAASNPVRELPPVAPAGSLTCLNEHPAPARTVPSRRTRGLALRAAAVAGVVVGGTALGLSGGASGPGVNVAAAAYAATSAGNRVIEAEFIVKSARPATSRTPLFRRREWLDAAAGKRREQTLDRTGKVRLELATSPGSAEIWANGPTPRGTITRFNLHASAAEPVKPDGLALYRKLYEERGVRVVGRESLGGQLVWKLEGVIAFATHRTGGPLIPIIGEVVLVDPHTYLPVVERQVELTRAGHPTMIETRLVHYRRLPRVGSSERLLHLSAVRPGARGATTGAVHTLSRGTSIPDGQLPADPPELRLMGR